MTQITRKSVPMRGLILLLTVTLGAGLVLVGCGDDDTATTPAPAPPPPPPPPAPEPEPEPEPEPVAPATPTGLMVSATTETSITWTWDAVEGAIGYAVQVSADEMFDATDTIHPAVEATFTASPLPPETSVFVRVAAAGGTPEAPILSAWTTHVTGTSAMPPPPAPAPEAPATPTGLTSESGEGSITWSWEAVEGADGYAVQVSMDEMFDDMDETTYTMETTHSVADLGHGEARYARVASTSGEGEAMLMSMWTTHTTGMSAAAPPPPPAPMAPAAPAGLTAESGDGSITWSWEAVEGADGYAVQVSMDEMFGDAETTYTMETTHSVGDLGYAATRYARVASTSGEGDGMLMSGWTTHATGTSAMAPPPPPEPAPDPVMVTFSLPDDESEFMEADGDDDEASARADVNDKIMVESNASAIITPRFVDGANGVSIDEGSNTPFGRVDWSMLQSDVLDPDGGATFMVQRATIGANQEMEPSGDVMHVTCGPFACQEGMDPPEITIENSSVCDGFDPELVLQVGKIDNDVVESTDSSTDVANDGLDIGWVTSQKGAMSVTHHFSDVTDGKNYKVAGRDSTSGTDKPLAMDKGDGDAGVDGADDPDKDEDTDNSDYGDALMVSEDSETVTTCLAYDSRNVRGGLDKPDNCFRIVGDPDYLNGYTVEVAAKDSGVTWGSVRWEDDPFEDLECQPMTFAAADQVDVCVLFEEEVTQATEEGWEDLTWIFTDANDGTDTVLSELRAAVKGGASPRQFTTLWFDHDLDGKIKKDPMHDLYDQNDSDTTDTDPGTNRVGGENQANQMYIEISLLDKDQDPNIGDFGKVDILETDREDDPDTSATEDASDFAPDGKADNFTPAAYSDVRDCTEGDGGDDADDTICDASQTWEVDVAFASGTFDCTAERSFTISCSWDASGERNESRRDSDQTAAVELTVDNIGDFLKCEVE